MGQRINAAKQKIGNSKAANTMVKALAVTGIVSLGGYFTYKFLTGDGDDAVPPEAFVDAQALRYYVKETNSTEVVSPGQTIVAELAFTNASESEQSYKVRLQIEHAGSSSWEPSGHIVKGPYLPGDHIVLLEAVVPMDWGKYDNLDVRIQVRVSDVEDTVPGSFIDEAFLIDPSGTGQFIDEISTSYKDQDVAAYMGEESSLPVTIKHEGPVAEVKILAVLAREGQRDQGPWGVFHLDINLPAGVSWRSDLYSIPITWPSLLNEDGRTYDAFLTVVNKNFDINAWAEGLEAATKFTKPPTPWPDVDDWHDDVFRLVSEGDETEFEHLETSLYDKEIPIQVGDSKNFPMTFDHSKGPAMTVKAGVVFSVEDNTTGGRSYPYYVMYKEVNVNAVEDQGYSVNIPIVWPEELNRVGQNYDAFLFVAPVEFNIDAALNNWNLWDTIPWSSKFDWKKDVYHLEEGGEPPIEPMEPEGEITYLVTVPIVRQTIGEEVRVTVHAANITGQEGEFNCLVRVNGSGIQNQNKTFESGSFDTVAFDMPNITANIEVILRHLWNGIWYVSDTASYSLEPIAGTAQYGGKVLKTENSQPIGNAMVISTDGSYGLDVNMSGLFLFSSIPLGPRTFKITAPGRIPIYVDINFTGDVLNQVYYLPLEPVSTYDYGGKVWIYINGQPTGWWRTDAVVTLVSPDGSYQDYTDANGEFLITNIPEGRYTIYIAYSGYETTVTSDIPIFSNSYNTEWGINFID